MTNDDQASFADLLRRYRTEAGLSQEALAEKTGLSVGAVGLHERGERRRPHRHTVQLYAEALALSPEERSSLERSARATTKDLRFSTPTDGWPAMSFPSYPLPRDGPFLGREAVLDDLLTALPTKHGTSPPRLALLTGDAGMGKTRVLAELAQRAHENGLLVLAGGCYEQEGRLPYGPLHDALLDYVRAQPEPALRAQLGHLLPHLARIVPEIGDRVPGLRVSQSGDGEEQRLRVFWTITRVLDRISQSQPLVLILDDLQWADDATIQALHFLLRRPTPHRLLVVGAYRREEVIEGGAIASLLEQAERQTLIGQSMCHIELEPLDEQDFATLLATTGRKPCSPGLAREIHERSRGNPFFGLQMLGLLQQEGRLVEAADGRQIGPGPPISLPVIVQETVARRLRHLTPEAREALALGAVLGREFDAAALEALWDRGERELFDALDTAVAQGVLEETMRGYAFRHPLLREVVYMQLSARRRARLHERAADALEGMYGERASEHAAELAHHLLEAGSAERDRVARYLTWAARKASDAYAWEAAVQLYQAALKQEDDEERIAAILEQMALVLQSLGRYEEALQTLETAAQRYRVTGDLEREGQVTAQIGEVHFLRGTVTEGAARIGPILVQLDRPDTGSQGPTRALAALYAAQARLTGMQLPVIERAVELARAVGDDRLLATAEVRHAIAFIQQARGEEARRVLEDILPVAEATGEYVTLNLALGVLSETLKAAGEFETCLALRERMLHHAEQASDPLQVASARAHVGESLFLLGDWSQARQYLEHAMELGQSLTSPWHTAFALLGMAELELAQGNDVEALQHIETCLADARRLGHDNWVRNAERLWGDLEVAVGRPDTAVRRFESLVQEEGQELPATMFRLASAYLASGNETGAHATIGKAVRLARERHRRFDLCESLIVQGRLYLRQNRIQDAEAVTSEALSLSRTMPYPYAEARALAEYAAVGRAMGDRDRQRAYLEKASGIFRRLRARPDLERTQHVLAQFGVM